MKRYLLRTVIALCLPIIISFKCDCDYNGSFLKLAPNAPLVSLVRVKKFLTFKHIDNNPTPMSMEVELIDTYKGLDTRKTFTVWGDPGNLCRPYLSVFKEGHAYVIAFFPAGRNQGEKSTDHTISSCGCYWLSADLEKKVANGDINNETRAVESISLAQLKSKFTPSK